MKNRCYSNGKVGLASIQDSPLTFRTHIKYLSKFIQSLRQINLTLFKATSHHCYCFEASRLLCFRLFLLIGLSFNKRRMNLR